MSPQECKPYLKPRSWRMNHAKDPGVGFSRCFSSSSIIVSDTKIGRTKDPTTRRTDAIRTSVKPLPDFDIRLGESGEFADDDISSTTSKQQSLRTNRARARS